MELLGMSDTERLISPDKRGEDVDATLASAVA
jgi:hypothetical protein